MSITTKLVVSFTATLLIIVGVAATAIRISLNYERSLDSLYRDHVQGTAQLADAMDALWRLRYGFPQFMVLGSEDRQRIVAEEPRLYAAVERNLKTYASQPRSREERESLQQLEESFRRYVDARPRWFELYGAGKLQEAAVWRARTTTPFGAETVVALERQVALQQEVAKLQLHRTLDGARNSRDLLFAVLAVLLIAVSVIFVVALRMLRPLRSLRHEAEAKVREVFGETVETTGRDEVETVVSAFQRMTQRFISHAKELTRAREELDHQREALERTVAERTAELSKLAAGTRQQAEEATLLYEMGDRLQSCHSVEEASTVARLFAGKLFPGYGGALYVTRASRNLLEPSVTWGATGLDHAFSPEDCWALRRGKPHRTDARLSEVPCAHFATPPEHACLCVPLIAQGDAIGLLHLQSPNGTAESAASFERLAVGAASQIGLAVGNLRLRETLRMQSLRDPLTGLYNRRFLDETLERETARAKRRNLPLTVLMIDADHFKRFNDSHGHEAGDIALRAIGQLLREHFRVSDYSCRYGGEEFTVVMPEAPLEAARQRGEALREAAARLALTQSGRPLGPITLSLGLATMPEHGDTPQALLQAADAALYRAKQTGRNRLVVSGASESDGR